LLGVISEANAVCLSVGNASHETAVAAAQCCALGFLCCAVVLLGGGVVGLGWQSPAVTTTRAAPERLDCCFYRKDFWFGWIWRLDARARGGHPRRGTRKTVVAVQGRSFEGASLMWFVGCCFWILFFGFLFFGCVLHWVTERQTGRKGERETRLEEKV